MRQITISMSKCILNKNVNDTQCEYIDMILGGISLFWIDYVFQWLIKNDCLFNVEL